MDWTRILACVTGTVDRELLARWTDFFIAEVLTLRVLVTCYMLFFRAAGWISPGSPFIRMRRAHAHSDDVCSHR